MKDTETRTIDGIQFRVTQLGFRKSRQVMVRLSKTLGPALAEALDSANNLSNLDLVKVVGTLISTVGEDDLEYFSAVFGESTEYNTDGSDKWPRLSSANQEMLFTGRMLTFFRWLGFCVEYNYSDFFGVLSARASDHTKSQ